MMRPICPSLALVLGAALLASCGSKPDERKQAAGEILEGTASDAMIATDQSRSEAPIAPRAPGDGKTSKDKAKARGPSSAPGPIETAATPTPTPESSPAPSPSPSAT